MFAEFEHEIPRKRIRAGIVQARRKGTRLGRSITAAIKAGQISKLHRAETPDDSRVLLTQGKRRSVSHFESFYGSDQFPTRGRSPGRPNAATISAGEYALVPRVSRNHMPWRYTPILFRCGPVLQLPTTGMSPVRPY